MKASKGKFWKGLWTEVSLAFPQAPQEMGRSERILLFCCSGQYTELLCWVKRGTVPVDRQQHVLGEEIKNKI